MPSFLDYQEKARKRTRLFVALHLLCVAAIAFLVGALALATMWLVEGDGSDSIPRAFVDARLGPVAAVVGIVIAIVALATLYRTSQLRGGGGKVAESLGGRRVRADTHDRLERRLLHVVEEMAIASRVAIPSVYVLDEEPGINAFAAGWSPNDAAVAVTRGALESLSREELQCVVGHEFSHILNGDMRLNVRMLGSIFGLVCLSVVGRVLMRAGVEIPRSSRPRRSKDEDGVLGIALLLILVGLFVWLLGLLGVLFGRILQSTISRQREFLADASSVQFTRNPHGMASALETIGASARHGTVAAARAPEIAHMLFAASGAERLFASHPPLDARIRRFEPDFDGRFDRAAARLAARRRTGGTREEEDDDRDFPFRGRGGILGGEIGVPGGGVLGGAVLGEALRTPPPPPPRGGARPPAEPAAEPARPVPIGPRAEPGPPPLPGTVPAELRSPAEAPAALCGALLDRAEGPVREAQLAALRAVEADHPDLAARALGWHGRLAALTPRARRAWCEIAASALRGEPLRAREALAGLLERLVEADGAVTPFEFAVGRLFRNRLLPPPPSGSADPAARADEARTLLFAMAEFGADDPATRAAAFARGLAALPAAFGRLPAEPAPPLSPDALGDALDRLRDLPPAAKQGLLDACRAVVLADGRTTADEDHALFAVADTLDATGWTPAGLPGGDGVC